MIVLIRSIKWRTGRFTSVIITTDMLMMFVAFKKINNCHDDAFPSDDTNAPIETMPIHFAGATSMSLDRMTPKSLRLITQMPLVGKTPMPFTFTKPMPLAGMPPMPVAGMMSMPLAGTCVSHRQLPLLASLNAFTMHQARTVRSLWSNSRQH
jgi:hypothetical protein